MKTADAVQYVLDVTELTKYRMAKELGLVSATSINQWLANTKMSGVFADKFEELYGVKIDDAVRPPSSTSE